VWEDLILERLYNIIYSEKKGLIPFYYEFSEGMRTVSTLRVLQGDHNNLKGHYYEREVLLGLIKSIIDNDGGLTEGISVTDFSYKLNVFLETGKEIDIARFIFLHKIQSSCLQCLYNRKQDAYCLLL
jgi:hypothetical protein